MICLLIFECRSKGENVIMIMGNCNIHTLAHDVDYINDKVGFLQIRLVSHMQRKQARIFTSSKPCNEPKT